MNIVQPKNWRWWVALIPSLVVELANVAAYLLAAFFRRADNWLDAISFNIGSWVLRR